ncbi:MAG: hypothetical protein KUG56_07235 [Kordiimonadaceae bacterium]|nr:hypothetical protein [Kordiimonadaceae bacterium]
MPFYDCRDTIAEGDIGIDRIRCSYEYPILPRRGLVNFTRRFTKHLQSEGIEVTSVGNRSFKINVEVDNRPIAISIKFNRPNSSKPLYCTANINAVEVHNHLEGNRLTKRLKGERPYYHANNWLRENDQQTRSDQSLICEILISGIEEQLTNTVAGYYLANRGKLIQVADIRIMETELATNITGVNSSMVIDRIERDFSSSFKNTKKKKYPSSFMYTGV